MFALSFAIAALAAASSVVGFPTKRAGAPSCANLGSIGFTNSGPFTLVAFDSAGNSMPLVFREESVLDGGDVAYVISVRAIRCRGAGRRKLTFEPTVTQTDSSGNSNPFPTLSLQDGRLIPMAMNGTGARGNNVADGVPISFVTGSDVDPSTGAQEYCGAVRSMLPSLETAFI